jgi:hypothetical protein
LSLILLSWRKKLFSSRELLMLLRFFGVALKDALVLAPGPEHFAFEEKF